MLEKAITRANGTLATAAKLLGISRPTLYTLMEAHGLAPAALASLDAGSDPGHAEHEAPERGRHPASSSTAR